VFLFNNFFFNINIFYKTTKKKFPHAKQSGQGSKDSKAIAGISKALA
jgi:hypothetical protein